MYIDPTEYNPFEIILVQFNTDCNVLNTGLSKFPHVSAIFSADEPTVETTAIPATVKLIIVAAVTAVPAETPTAVSRLVSSGTSAAPPVATTAAIASAAPTMIAAVAAISCQCSAHHSAALSNHSSRKFFSASGFR